MERAGSHSETRDQHRRVQVDAPDGETGVHTKLRLPETDIYGHSDAYASALYLHWGKVKIVSFFEADDGAQERLLC